MKDEKSRDEPKIEKALEYGDRIIATLREPFLVLDKNLRVISTNPSFYNTFQVTEKDTLGRPLPDLGDGQWNIPKLLVLLREILPQKGVVENYEIEHEFGQIGLRCMNLNASQLRIPKKIAVIIAKEAKEEEEEEEELILLAIEDITDRKKAQEVLRASEARYRFLANNAMDIIWTADLQLQYTYISPSVMHIYGFTPDEVLGQSVAKWLTPDSAQLALKQFTEELTLDASRPKDRVHTVQLKHMKKDGSTVWVEVKMSFVRGLDGKPVSVLGFSRDITERKQAEQVLQASENRYRNLFASSRDAIMTLEPPLWKFTSGNPATIEMFQAKDEAEFLACSPWQLSPELQPDGRPSIEKAKERIETAVREGACLFEWVHKRLNGEVFVAEVLLSKVELGEKVFLLAAVRDIAERKTAEIELRRAEELKTAAEVKSKFTSMVSHELRSPLTVIQSSMALISDGLVGKVNEEQKKLLAMGQKNVERLGRLINNVLDFQKIEFGKMEYDFRENDINETIREVSESLKILLGKKDLDLRVKFGEGLPKIKFDKDKLIQVLTNLINNAIKFTLKGSITVSVLKENNVVHVEIRDTGPGIKAEDLPRLFQPFEQLDQGRGRQKGGTGLGLAITKEIIHAHGGKIWAESEMDKGSVFHFTLPVLEHRRPA